jgi:hypothetical protein
MLDAAAYTPRLKADYVARIRPAMMTEFGYKNVYQVPKLEKIVINIGLGESIQNGRAVDAAVVHTGAEHAALAALTDRPVAVAALPPHLPDGPARPRTPGVRRRLLFFGKVRRYKGVDVLLQALTGHQFLSPEVYYISDLPSELKASDVIRISILSLALGLLSTLYPAWRASRVQPAEALRYE